MSENALERSVVNNIVRNRLKFILICLLVIFLELILIKLSARTPITEFSQNMLKTSIFTSITILPLYVFVVLYRFLNKKNRYKTLKQIMSFIIFLLGVIAFSFIIDFVLVELDRDLSDIASNAICFSVMIIYLILQHIFIIRKNDIVK
jgi:uncharacterized BrkB/YihY/UPF0761 family membrane protein